MRNLKTSVLSTSMSVVLCACGNTAVVSPDPPRPNPEHSTSASPNAGGPPPLAAQSMPSASLLPAYLDPNSTITKDRSVFFEFDSAVVMPEFSGLIAQHGRYLMENPRIAIRVEGNTDERGGAEYNLALGQKRAESVRRALKAYGVSESQVEAVSWGEERPRATGHGQSDWQQNRRADLRYPSK